MLQPRPGPFKMLRGQEGQQSAQKPLLKSPQYSVLQSTTPVLLQYYKVLLQYYSVLQSLLQHYSVLQSTTPVLLRTTKYYSSTIPYYRVLVQYYSVLQSLLQHYSSTTPYYKLQSLLQHYSSTTPYYKVLLQYYSSTTPYLQSTTPVLLRTTKSTPVLLRTTKSTPVLLRTYKVLLQYYSVLQSTTPVLLRTTPYYSSTTPYYSSTTKYYSSTTPYYKVLLQYYSVLQSTSPVQQSTSPVLLRTTKYYYYKVFSSTTPYYKVLFQYYKVLLQYYSVLQSTTPVLLRTTKYYSSTTPYYKELLQYYKVILHYYSVLQSTSPVILRTTRVLLRTTKYYSSTTSPSTAPVTKSATWPSPSTAPATKSNTWPSPSTAPATQNDSHAWSSSHMKRHLQCEEQQMSPSKLTKYCACHAKWPPNIWQKFAENSWNVISNARPIRAKSEWSDHEPVSPQPAAQQRLPFALRTSILYWKIQDFALRLSFQISPSTAPATKSDTWPSPSTAPVTKSATWPSPSTAPVTKSNTWPAPSTAPATKSDTHAWSSSHITSFTMRGATNVTIQTHQILRLPRKMTTQHLAEICGKQLKRHFQCAADPSMIRDRSENDPRPFPSVRNPPRNRGYFSRSGRAFCIEKYNISSSGYLSKFHQVLRLPRKVTLDLHQVLRLPRKAWSSSHMKRHLQCAEQQVSPSKLTKYCACHAKWPKFAENSWNVISSARPIRDRSEHDPRPFRDRSRQSATRHATEVTTFRAQDENFVLKITTLRAPAIFPNFTKYCACHEK